VKTRAAICREIGAPWVIEDVIVEDPGPRDVLVEMRCAGLCHSDEHLRLGDMGAPVPVVNRMGARDIVPFIGGHEGSGVVIDAGRNVQSVKPGDPVAMSFVPACGTCWSCVRGEQHLCDNGAWTLAGPMIHDKAWRHHTQDGAELNRMGALGTFASHVLTDERSVIKVENDVSWVSAALASCGIATGFGSSVTRADVQPGEVVVVVGCGGVGHGALIGASVAGARIVVAVEPSAYRRDSALSNGATHAAASLGEAMGLVRDISRGRMADVVILAVGIATGDLLAPALALVAKSGRLVLTAVAPWKQRSVELNMFDLTLFNKAILGSVYGSTSPRQAIQRLTELEREGRVDLARLATHRYSLDDVNRGYEDMYSGSNVRGVITF
jgi:NDMA-dependent alcohol dehydrogenase